MDMETLEKIVRLADSLDTSDGEYIEIRNGKLHAGRNPAYRAEVIL